MKMIYDSNEKAYTLMETLIVLLMISTILLIAFPRVHDVLRTNDLEYFFEQLEKDLYEAQMQAMSEGIIVRISFSVDDEHYSIRHGTNIVKTRQYPKGLMVSNGSLSLNNLRYLPNGNLYATGTIHFYYKGKRHTLVFQFLRGRFYFDK